MELKQIRPRHTDQCFDSGIVHIHDQGHDLKPSAHAVGQRPRLIQRQIARRIGMKHQPAIARARRDRRIDGVRAGEPANFDRNCHGLGCMGLDPIEIKQSRLSY